MWSDFAVAACKVFTVYIRACKLVHGSVGMVYEKMQSYNQALASYEAGVTLLDRLAISRTTPQDKHRRDLFLKYRELWRWAEKAMRGATIVAAKLRFVSARRLRVNTDESKHQQVGCRSVAFSWPLFHLFLPLDHFIPASYPGCDILASPPSLMSLPSHWCRTPTNVAPGCPSRCIGPESHFGCHHTISQSW